MYRGVAAGTSEIKEFTCFRNIETGIKIYKLAFDQIAGPNG
mgnify:CR=1 FL=1